MEVVNKVFDLLAANIDFAFMLSVNVLTFLLIKFADEKNKQKKVTRFLKRLITLLAGIALAVPLVLLSALEIKVALYSFVLSLVSWDGLFKHIIKKWGIGYKDE